MSHCAPSSSQFPPCNVQPKQMEKTNHLLDSTGIKNQTKASLILHLRIPSSLWLLVRPLGPLRVHRKHCSMWHILLRDSMSSWLRIRLIFFWTVSRKLQLTQVLIWLSTEFTGCAQNVHGSEQGSASPSGQPSGIREAWVTLWLAEGWISWLLGWEFRYIFFHLILFSKCCSDWLSRDLHLPKPDLFWEIKQDHSHPFPHREIWPGVK